MPPAGAPAHDDYARIKALFLEVCDLPGEAAARAYLAAHDVAPELAAEVLAMLREDAANSTRFSAPVAHMAAAAAGAELAPGDTLGAWRLLSALGEGGMGQVFLAERSDGHYEQRAAIKLLRGWTGPGALEQLARERQILASLNHPHIARLLDGGATPAGRPYLVMDFVQGLRLDAYVRDRALSLDALLALFDMICDAVAYAHRQLVVHCDIKPANVLVDAQGRAQLLDFGIAQLQDKSEPGPRAHTPQYASPEQRAGEPGRPASDIYALGRVLEELLRDNPAAVRRRDEWQAVVACACAADPAARYASVDALQEDLRRLRHHQPLRAMPDQGLYRVRKALRRHWPWALAGSGVAVLTLAFTVRLVHERNRSLEAEASARHEAATAEQVSGLLVRLFEGADPARGGRPDLTAAALVDRGRERLAEDLKDQPELQARMYGVLGQVYSHLGQPQTSLALLAQTADMEQRLGHRLAEANARRDLASALAEAGQAAKAVAPARRAVELRQQAGADPLRQAQAMATLGYALSGSGSYDEAQTWLDQALALLRQDPATPAAEVASVIHLQGLLAVRRGQLEPGRAKFEEALRIRREQLGPNHPDTLTSQQQLGATLVALNRSEDAQPLLRDLVERRRALFGPSSVYTATALNELAGALQDAAHTAQAVAAYREAAAVEEKLSGRPSARLAVALNNLAGALDEQGDPAAEVAYRDALAQRQAVLPAGDLAIARGQQNLGRWLMRAGRLAEARTLLDASQATRAAKLPPSHDEVLGGLLTRAELELADHHPAAAQAALDGIAPHEAELRPLRKVAYWRAQGLLHEARGDHEAARAAAQKALAAALERVDPAHPTVLRLRLELAQHLLGAGDTAGAHEQWRSVVAPLTAQHARSPLRALARAVAAALGEAPPALIPAA